MASGAEKPLRVAIQQRVFDRAYYLYGEDDYLKDEAVRRLIEAAVDPALHDFNVEVRRAAELSAETLGSLLGTPPMLAERRIIVLKDVGGLKKDARKVLDGYLAAPAVDLVLAMTTPAGAKPDKGLLGMATGVEFTRLSGSQLPRWIARHVEEELDTKIAPAAVSLLQDAVGNDLAQLALELSKAASYANGGVIDEAAISEVVGLRREETLGAFLDAVARKQLSVALDLLPGVLQQPKTSAVTVVLALGTQTLALAWGKTLRSKGVPSGRLEQEFYGLLREGSSSFTGRSWGEAVRAWARAVDGWESDELDNALAQLLAADRSLKDSRVSSEEQILTTLVLTICTGPKPRVA